jgi:hypothetical protein
LAGSAGSLDAGAAGAASVGAGVVAGAFLRPFISGIRRRM